MKRRTFLTTTGAVAAASTFPAPAIAQGIRELRLVSSYPLTPGTKLLVRTITEASGGRLRVKAFPAGKLVDAFEVFDAVREGIADMYYSVEYFWKDRSPAFSFFAGVPFGLTSSEMDAWMHRGGGQKLWDELSAEYNIKPFLAGNTGVQMGGWYKKEITSIDSFKGLRIRIPGLGGEVMRRMGGDSCRGTPWQDLRRPQIRRPRCRGMGRAFPGFPSQVTHGRQVLLLPRLP